VAALPAGMVAGWNEQEDFAGRFEQASVIAAPVAGLGVKEMCSVTDCPAVTVTEGSVGAIVNPGLLTVTLAVACAVAPLASTTVSITLVTPTA